MNDKQIYLIHWLYNFAITEMKLNQDKFMESDEEMLKEAIERRFPEYVDDITKPFDIPKSLWNLIYCKR